MIGKEGLEPTDASSATEPDTGSFALKETEEEEPTTSQEWETKPIVSEKPSSRVPSTSTSFVPSRSIFRNLSNDISNNIAQEQEDFFLKNAMATRGHYEGADGDLLIPRESLQKIEGMIDSRFPVQLKTSCEAVTITVPSGSGEPVPAVVDILGKRVEAKVKTSAETMSFFADAELIYMYTVNAGEGSTENASWTVARTTRYRPNSEGHWRKTKVEERVIAEVTPKPSAKTGTGIKKSSTKAKGSSTSKTTSKKAKQPVAPVRKETLLEKPQAAAPKPATTGQASTTEPSTATPPAPTTPPQPTEAPPKPTVAPPAPAAPSGGAEFDEMLIPDLPDQ